MSALRIGHVDRPSRAWEVWNDNYSRITGEFFRHRFDEPWNIWHPVIETGSDTFETHAKAIAYISAGDWDA